MPLDRLLGPPVRIQPYLGYRTRERLVIGARALHSLKPGFERGGRLQAARTMWAQFASREARDIRVTLEIGGPDGLLLKKELATDAEGHVRFDLPLDPTWDLPPEPAWETVALRWSNRAGPQCIEGHVLAPGRDAKLAVISDIDDTIIETGITGGFRSIARNWRRVLAELPDERIAAPGADAFYGALGGGQILPEGETRPGTRVPATRRPFFYVSSSPWNLFAYLVAFKRAKNLPMGPLLLRDWGFDRATLGSAGHGRHKQQAIEHILGMYRDWRFALIGDDTQSDLPAYAAAVEHFPGRVAAIFIRKATGTELSVEEVEARALIEAAGVPMWMGESYEIGQDFLHAAGFTPGGEAEQIVTTTEEAA